MRKIAISSGGGSGTGSEAGGGLPWVPLLQGGRGKGSVDLAHGHGESVDVLAEQAQTPIAGVQQHAAGAGCRIANAQGAGVAAIGAAVVHRQPAHALDDRVWRRVETRGIPTFRLV